MKNLKEKLSKLSVLIFGDVYLDRDCIGEFSGKSKEDEHMLILKVHTEKYQPGGAGNLASCFAALGVKTIVVGLWGERYDFNRQILEQKFKDRGIDTSFMVESGKTLVFGKFYTNNGHVFRYDVISENMTEEVKERIIANLNVALFNTNFIACADYNNSGIKDLVCEDTLKPILDSKLVKFATGRKDINKFKGFSCLLLNKKEFLEQNFGDNGFNFIDRLYLGGLVVTSGTGSVSYDSFDSSGSGYMSKSTYIEGDIDTCGCGDMFYAMYSSCIKIGYGSRKSSDLANLAAGIVAKKKFGAAQASIDEIINNL